MVHAVLESNFGQPGLTLLARRLSRHLFHVGQGEGHVLECGQVGIEIETLKHHADLATQLLKARCLVDHVA